MHDQGDRISLGSRIWRCAIATILIVDDSVANRDLIAAILSAQGHRMLEARDGLDGLNVALAEKPDLIIADILMPTMNGFEFVARLRESSVTTLTPVIFYSAMFQDAEMQSLARACGVSRILSKPAQPEEVLRLVREALISPDPAGPPISPSESGIEVVKVLNRKLFEKNGELLELNAQLDQRVTERTAELEQANQLLRLEIEKREKLERKIRQIDRLDAVGKLAAGLAHNFNNLLAVIHGQSESLLAHSGEWESVHKLESINRAVEHGMNLTFQLLGFAGQRPLGTEVVNFNSTLSSLEKLLQVTLGESIDLEIYPETELAVIDANPGQLEQVLVNLALSAKKAMPDGGRLTIRTSNLQVESTDDEFGAVSNPGPYICVSVSDTGRGMDETSQNLIFDPDFTTNGLEGGTTLGLSTVYGIVKQGGGQILVYSEPGKGTTFNIYWPQMRPPVESAQRIVRQESWQNPKTILVVEDEVLLLEVTCEFLEETGYTVLSARSSEGALELARTHDGPIDLLLTDVVMPRMNGQELSARLLRDRPQMKVLFVSGYSSDVVSGQELGTRTEGFGFLQKPFSRLTLKEKIRELIASESISSA